MEVLQIGILCLNLNLCITDGSDNEGSPIFLNILYGRKLKWPIITKKLIKINQYSNSIK